MVDLAQIAGHNLWPAGWRPPAETSFEPANKTDRKKVARAKPARCVSSGGGELNWSQTNNHGKDRTGLIAYSMSALTHWQIVLVFVCAGRLDDGDDFESKSREREREMMGRVERASRARQDTKVRPAEYMPQHYPAPATGSLD